MRVLHVSDCYLPRLGGIEVQVRDLAARQSARGDHVAVATATEGTTVRTSITGAGLVPDDVDGLSVYRIAMRVPGDFPVHPRVAHHLARVLDLERPDVVHVHAGSISPFAYPALRYAAQAGYPVVVTVHSVWARARQATAWMDSLSAWNDWGVVATTVSEVAAEPMRRVLGPAADIRLLPNGIDVDRWRVERRPSTVRDDPRTHVVAVMRLAPRKRVLPLARMLRRAIVLAAPDPGIRATIIGDGPERAVLARYLDRHGLSESVRLVGRLTRDEIRAGYAETDAFIAPAILESYGIAAMEARTAGVPVVARSTSGVASFIRDGVEGLLADDDDDMAAALARLADEPALRERIAAHNASSVPESDWGRVLALTDEVYDLALARRRVG